MNLYPISTCTRQTIIDQNGKDLYWVEWDPVPGEEDLFKDNGVTRKLQHRTCWKCLRCPNTTFAKGRDWDELRVWMTSHLRDKHGYVKEE